MAWRWSPSSPIVRATFRPCRGCQTATSSAARLRIQTPTTNSTTSQETSCFVRRRKVSFARLRITGYRGRLSRKAKTRLKPCDKVKIPGSTRPSSRPTTTKSTVVPSRRVSTERSKCGKSPRAVKQCSPLRLGSTMVMSTLSQQQKTAQVAWPPRRTSRREPSAYTQSIQTTWLTARTRPSPALGLTLTAPTSGHTFPRPCNGGGRRALHISWLLATRPAASQTMITTFQKTSETREKS